MATTKFQYIGTDGRNRGITATDPLAAELIAKGASGGDGVSYVVGVHDIYDDSTTYDHLLHRTVTNKLPGVGWDMNAEWYCLVNDSNGTDFQLGEDCTQVIGGGDNVTATIAGFEPYTSGGWNWKDATETSGTALLLLKNLGATNGTGGVIAPTGGTGNSGGGPGASSGTPHAIIGDVSGANWKVIGISQRILPSSLVQVYVDTEVEGLTQPDYSSLHYGTSLTADFSNFAIEHDLDDHIARVSVNHKVFASSDVSYIHTITLYDNNNVAVVVDAVSGGSGGTLGTADGTQNSQLNYLYANFRQQYDTYKLEIEEIENAYGISGGGFVDTPLNLNSVLKVRTLYNTRNP